MNRNGWFLKSILIAITVFLGMIAMRLYVGSETVVAADSGRFDYANIISPTFLYKGNQGILLLDKRNGNVWFLGRNGGNMTLSFADPVFVARVPLEKLDQTPH